MRFELEWSPTPGKAPEMQIVTFAPPTYIGCALDAQRILRLSTTLAPNSDQITSHGPHHALAMIYFREAWPR